MDSYNVIKKNGSMVSRRWNSRLGNNILASAFLCCFGFLAACTSNDDSLDGTDTGANVKTASNVSVKQSSSDRITLFKTNGTRAVTRSVATDLTMPEKPAIPSDAVTIENENELTKAYGQSVIHIAKGAKINNDSYDLDFSNATIYVEGEFNIRLGGSNVTIYVYEGGLITNQYLFAGDGYTIRKIYNYGGTVKQYSGCVMGAATTYMTTGDFTLTGKTFGTLYIGGNLTWDYNCKEIMSGTIAVKEDFTCNYDFNFGGDPTSKTVASMYIGGSFTAPNAYINTYGDVTVGCSMNVTNTLQVNGESCSLNLLNGGYVKANDIIWTEAANVTIGNGGLIEGTNSIAIKNVGKGTITLDGGSSAVGAVVTKSLSTNNVNMTSVFKVNGILALMYDEIIDSDNRALSSQEVTLNANVKTKDNKNFSISIDKTTCSPGYSYSNNEEEEPGTDPDPKPFLDDVAKIDPEHTHPISATCVDFNKATNKAYLCWHARGVGQAGCLEILDHTLGNEPKLVSYLQAYASGIDNDSQSYIDYNHCIYDNQRLYAVGNMYKKGGHMSYVELTEDGLFKETESQSNETTDLIGKGALKYKLLKVGNRTSCDGNCIIRLGNDYLVASTSGFETIDASSLESTNFNPTTGKGKHIASDGNKILTLNYDRFIDEDEDETTALGAVVKVYDANDHKFESPTTVADGINQIEPNNGKNTIKIDGDYAYVCLANNGLARYNINGGEEPKIYTVAPVKNAKGVLVSGACNGVDIDENYIYVAYGSLGLHVLDKTTWEEIDSYVCAGGKSCNYVKVVERDGVPYVYIAYGESGFQVQRLITSDK